MYKVELISILKDNYVFLVIDNNSNQAIIVDPGLATPVADTLISQKLKLTAIILTHHHSDHIGGAADLGQLFNAPIYAPIKNKSQIPAKFYVQDSDILNIGSFEISVIDLPGHTLGHTSYYFKKQKWLFSGDVLFGLGCGRLFEGNPTQAFDSLQKIKSLDAETSVYCTHEYTEANLKFCKSLTTEQSPDLIKYEKNLLKKRSQNQPSVPLTLSEECTTNPFLLAKNVEEFTNIRNLRNQF